MPVKALSLDEISSKVRRAFYALYEMANLDCWVLDVYADSVIVEMNQEYYRVAYTLEDGSVTLATRDQWQAVEKEWAAKSLMVHVGDAVKSLDGGKFGGYLVRFTSADDPDLTGDFFSAETDFDLDWDDENKCTVYFNHGLDPVLKNRKLTEQKAVLKKDDVGIWMEGILAERDEYEKFIAQQVKAEAMGLSSGTNPTLVTRQRVKSAYHITSWPLGKDGSITHIPAEYRNVTVPLKSLAFKSLGKPEASEPEAPQGAADAASATRIEFVSNGQEEGNHMPDNTGTPPAGEQDPIEAKFAAFEERVAGLINPVIEYLENLPQTVTGGYITPDGGTADKNVKNIADMLFAIKRKDVTRCTKHYGLKLQVEDGGTTGGYLVPTSTITDLLPGISLVSPIGQLVRRIPVSTPAGEAPIRDYSRTPTADAGNAATAMGIESQGRTEGGDYTEETMYFELLQWRAYDYASGYIPLSKELRADAPMIESLIREGIEEDVANKEEFAILRGNGVGKPRGVLNWAGIKEVDEDTDNTFAVEDSDEMVDYLLESMGSRVAWVHHPGVGAQIAAFERGTGAAALHSDMAGRVSQYLHGFPRYKSQHLPAQGTDGYVILGDWKQYILFEYGGLYIDYSEDALFLSGKVAWRFGKRQDGKPAMTSAVTLADGSHTLSPFVILANKT